MCYHDIMEPEGGGQDKAKAAGTKIVYIMGKDASDCDSGERLFLCISGIGGGKGTSRQARIRGASEARYFALGKNIFAGTSFRLGDALERESG